MVNWLKRTLALGSGRTAKAKRNVIYILISRSLTVLLSFGIVRVTYNLLDEELYGIWLTLLSILSWINLFDLGLGNGLRNKLAESLARGDKETGKIFVSTAYVMIGIFVALTGLIFIAIAPWISWEVIFNSNAVHENQLSLLCVCLVELYLLNFLFFLVKSVALAYQDAAIPAFMTLITNILIFIVLSLWVKSGDGSLNTVGFLYGLITVAVAFLFNIALFATRYRETSPSLRTVEGRYCAELFNLGIKFFVIKIAVLVIFTTDNLIITQVLGPEHVVPYQVVSKLFSVFTTAHGILLTPFWSAFTEANINKDYPWIKAALRKLLLLMIPMVMGVGILVAGAEKIIFLWLGDGLNVDYLLVVLMGFYVTVFMWSNIFTCFLNGTGNINLQMYSAILSGLINIPLSVYFAQNLALGTSGVILGSIVSISLGAVLAPVQTYFCLKKE